MSGVSGSRLSLINSFPILIFSPVLGTECTGGGGKGSSTFKRSFGILIFMPNEGESELYLSLGMVILMGAVGTGIASSAAFLSLDLSLSFFLCLCFLSSLFFSLSFLPKIEELN